MDNQVPQSFRAIQIVQFGQPPQVNEIPIPELEQGQVLIRVEAAPINPSDLGAVQGTYPSGKKLPIIPGFEGSGTIAKVGNGVPEQIVVGQRVAFFAKSQYGSYAEFAVAPFSGLLQLDEDVSFEQAASSFVNPVSVIGMHQITVEKKVTCVVHNAAASALGRMFVRYFQENNIKVINIVRRQVQVDLLKSEGAEIVLNQTDEQFRLQLKQLSSDLNATIFFDPVAGQQTGDILQLLPNGTTAYVYGGLSKENVGNVSVSDLLFKNKTITGFWLSNWLQTKGQMLGDQQFQAKLNTLLKTSLKTTYAKEYRLDEFSEAIEYYGTNQTAGKVLIKPHKQ